MNKIILLGTFNLFFSIVNGQQPQKQRGLEPYLQLESSSETNDKKRVILQSDIDPEWEKWKVRGYHFGFNPELTPMYTSVDGILSTPYMIQVRGNENESNKKRWGYHLFEGFARDNKSRLTMLVNKHEEIKKPVAEIYYYGTAYNHSNQAYNWVKIGSDVKNHSFMFTRDQAHFYGSLTLTNTLTLGNIRQENLRKEPPEGDSEQNNEASAQHVNYKALKEGGNGTIFYDADHDLVVIKVEGKWMKLKVEPLPEDVEYDF